MGNRTSLSANANVLRASLLVSLGLSAWACGGTAVTESDNSAGAPGNAGTGNAGAPGSAGSLGIAGNLARAGSGGTGSVACTESTLDPATGLEQCRSGLVHRPRAVTCDAPKPPAGSAGADSMGELGSPCMSDDECRGVHLGYCDFSGQLSPSCQSGCRDDSDCSANHACLCRGSGFGVCIPTGCQIDADCGPGSLCAQTSGSCSYGSFACTTPEDECQSDADCQSSGRFGYCTLLGGRRTCDGSICGRPFLVEEAPRFADITPRADWRDPSLSPSLVGLSPLQRAELAAHWSRLAQMEHASIAAFARFNLQLLALGAPANLVEACNQALIDETAHAKLCFAFASAYAGTKLGPSKLDMSHCFEETTLLSVTKLVIREGCIGETVAALEALEDAERAGDPVVRNALLRIAHDERNHAELAYRFVRWALSECTNEERSEMAFEAEQRLMAFESATEREEQRSAARLVVRPLLTALSAATKAA